MTFSTTAHGGPKQSGNAISGAKSALTVWQDDAVWQDVAAAPHGAPAGLYSRSCAALPKPPQGASWPSGSRSLTHGPSTRGTLTRPSRLLNPVSTRRHTFTMTEPAPESEPEPKPELTPAPPQTPAASLAKTYVQFSGVEDTLAATLAPIQAAFAASESVQAMSRAAQAAVRQSFDWDKLSPSVPALKGITAALRVTPPLFTTALGADTEPPLILARHHLPAQPDLTEVVVARNNTADVVDLLAKSIAQAEADATTAATERQAAAQAAAKDRANDIKRGWIMLILGIVGGGAMGAIVAAVFTPR